MNLINTLIKQTNAYKELDCDTYFRVHILCVHPSYQQKGISMALLKACINVASTLDISAIGGVFTSGLSQSLALKLGFRLVSEIRYSRWIVDDQVIFDDPGKGNYSIAFMGMPL
jgi:N-acetylglutamate synthase-like GNAT family acetyltransferase